MRNVLMPSTLALFALAAACSAGGGTSTPPISPGQSVTTATDVPQAANVVPGATVAPTPMPSTIVLKSGAVIGTDNRWSPNDSDSAGGGNGQMVDNVLPCKASMYETAYHVHAFVGIIYNKQQMALPDAIGLSGYGPEYSGVTNGAKCYYYLHTHDASGMVHIESPSTASLGSSLFTLGNFLDVWGQTLSSTGFGNFSGAVHVFVAKPALRSLYSGPFTAFTGDPHTIKLYSHEAIWIEVGSVYYTAAQLSQIRFYTEY